MIDVMAGGVPIELICLEIYNVFCKLIKFVELVNNLKLFWRIIEEFQSFYESDEKMLQHWTVFLNFQNIACLHNIIK
jgi:hypothetical protein